jgi:hypothetical protein
MLKAYKGILMQFFFIMVPTSLEMRSKNLHFFSYNLQRELRL